MHDKYLCRAKEVQKEEIEAGIFSPQLDLPPRSRSMPLDISRQATTSVKISEEASSGDIETVSFLNRSSECGNGCASNSSSSVGDDPSPSKETYLSRPVLISEPGPCSKGKAPVADEGETDFEGQQLRTKDEDPDTSLSYLIVTTSDLTCLHCCNLLYRPVVLNCGHMFCEHCVEIDDDNAVSCPSCKAEHPGMFPQVCLELHHYIDRVFPLEYAQRSLQVAAEERERPSNRPQVPMLAEPEVSTKGSVRRILPGPIHRDVGCDGCGMMPIVGKRFKCQECPETIGFDLCGKCHGSGCVVGRFNQRHTPDHCMKEVRLRASIEREFWDAMVSRRLNVADRRIIPNECNEPEDIQVLLGQPIGGSRGSTGGNGADVFEGPGPEQSANADGNGSIEVAEDGVHQVDYIQEADGDDSHIFMHDGGDEEFAGQDDEEFETFSRDDEDIEFYRVVFHA